MGPGVCVGPSPLLVRTLRRRALALRAPGLRHVCNRQGSHTGGPTGRLALRTLVPDREMADTRGPGAGHGCWAGPLVAHTDILLPCRGGGKSRSLNTQDSRASTTVSCSPGSPVEPGSEAYAGPWGCTRRVQMPQKLDTRTLLSLLSLQMWPPATLRRRCRHLASSRDPVLGTFSSLPHEAFVGWSPAEPSQSGWRLEERHPTEEPQGPASRC